MKSDAMLPFLLLVHSVFFPGLMPKPAQHTASRETSALMLHSLVQSLFQAALDSKGLKLSEAYMVCGLAPE